MCPLVSRQETSMKFMQNWTLFMEVMTRKIVHYLEAVVWGCDLTYEFSRVRNVGANFISCGIEAQSWERAPTIVQRVTKNWVQDGEMLQTVAKFNAKLWITLVIVDM